MKEEYFVLDIESTGLNAWTGDRITAIGIRTSDGKEWIFMGQDERHILYAFLNWWDIHNNEYKLMITKNGNMFDLPFIIARIVNWEYLQACEVKVEVFNNAIKSLLDFPHTDLHTITQKWISLDDFARIFCLPTKTGDGLQAIRLWKEGRLEELKAYLKHDLWLTEQVYLRRKHLGELNKDTGVKIDE